MFDNNWELIDGDVAHDIEVLNYANQVNVIEALVRYIMHHSPVDDGGCKDHPTSAVLREFHRTATLFLLKDPGHYRTAPVILQTETGEIVYTPPEWEKVESFVDSFFNNLTAIWLNQSAAEIGAFCLWFVNWVHPFKNGNGRTARAFCYACLSLKMGYVLPGEPTLIDLLMRDAAPYYAALRVADNAYEANGAPDLLPLVDLVERLLIKQLESVEAEMLAASTPSSPTPVAD